MRVYPPARNTAQSGDSARQVDVSDTLAVDWERVGRRTLARQRGLEVELRSGALAWQRGRTEVDTRQPRARMMGNVSRCAAQPGARSEKGLRAP